MEDFAFVLTAPHERVELDRSDSQDGKFARSRYEYPRTARLPKRRDVAADEVDGISRGQLFPGQIAVLATRDELRAEDRDRPLADPVDEAECAPLRLGVTGGVNADPARLELGCGCHTELVATERGEQQGSAGELGEADRRDSAAPGGLCPRLLRMDDLAGSGHVIDAGELHPLDVADDGDAHWGSLPPRAGRDAPVDAKIDTQPTQTREPAVGIVACEGGGSGPTQMGGGTSSGRSEAALGEGGPAGSPRCGSAHNERPAAVIWMMAIVVAPPFERFYLEHREAVLAFLRRRLPRDGADDAFQETFLRALRAYDRLAHTENLRGWIITIASRVALDAFPKLRGAEEIPDLESLDERPAYEELQELTQGLPPKERAAVVLRYGYDLDYTTIGDALGSSAEAARQAASSGVRRIRKKGNAHVRQP